MSGGEVKPWGCHDVSGFRDLLWTHTPLKKRALRVELREALAQHIFILKPYLPQEGHVYTRIHRDNMPGGEIEPRRCHDLFGLCNFLWTHTPLEESALRVELSEALAQHIFVFIMVKVNLVLRKACNHAVLREHL